MKIHMGGLKGRAVKGCIIGLAIAAGLFVFGKTVLWVSVYGFRTRAEVIKDARELSETIEKYAAEQEKYKEEMLDAAELQAESYASAAAVIEEKYKDVLEEMQPPDSIFVELEENPEKPEPPTAPEEAVPEAQEPASTEPAIEINDPTIKVPIESELRQADYAKLVFDSAKYYEENGKVVFTYSQPEIPGKYHLSVEMAVFNAEGGTIDRYCSDWGWRSDMKYYDPSAKDVRVKLNVSTLKHKEIIMTVMVGNSGMDADTTVYKLIEDVDGNKEIKTSNLKGGC